MLGIAFGAAPPPACRSAAPLAESERGKLYLAEERRASEPARRVVFSAVDDLQADVVKASYGIAPAGDFISGSGIAIGCPAPAHRLAVRTSAQEVKPQVPKWSR